MTKRVNPLGISVSQDSEGCKLYTLYESIQPPMTNHPITPPPEVLEGWKKDWHHSKVKHIELEEHIVTLAARWGANQELKACCEVLARELICDGKHVATDLRMIRRPKPPSLKEQALQVLESAPGPDYPNVMTVLDADQHALIRRALEALPND